MIELVLVGDVMLGRKVRGSDVFKNIKLSGDIKFANFESPFGDGFDFIDKEYLFSAEEASAEMLSIFDVLSLANNHVVDCDSEGIKNTVRVLKEKGISFVGIKSSDRQKPFVISKDNVKIGFLAYCKDRKYLRGSGIYLIDDLIVEDVKKAREEVDFLVVSLHWGREYKLKPSKKQEKLAKALVDNGANVIVGHHPHIVQKVEEYNNGLIAYSLGNFVFDQTFNSLVRKGMILKVEIENGIKSYKKINSYINDDFEVEIIK